MRIDATRVPNREEEDHGVSQAAQRAPARRIAAGVQRRAGAKEFIKLADPVDWKELRNAGFGFAERMQGHIQKEEMGLLPMIEDLIDAQSDEALAMVYAA
ncbi:MAG: hypothetical protein EXR31_07575 [Betaproteobacteria bacterium]|nr:hypothetical protein [Betaproteobacteria bacterium]